MKHAVLALGVACLAGIPALAHHSYGGFYLDRTVTLEGRLERLHYGNPHTLLIIRTGDGVVHTAEWRPASQLSQMGVASTTLQAGDRVAVAGSPPRDPSIRRLVTLKEVRRTADGWMWRIDGGRVTAGAP